MLGTVLTLKIPIYGEVFPRKTAHGAYINEKKTEHSEWIEEMKKRYSSAGDE